MENVKLPLIHVQEEGCCSFIDIVTHQLPQLGDQDFVVCGAHAAELLQEVLLNIIHFHFSPSN